MVQPFTTNVWSSQSWPAHWEPAEQGRSSLRQTRTISVPTLIGVEHPQPDGHSAPLVHSDVQYPWLGPPVHDMQKSAHWPVPVGEQGVPSSSNAQIFSLSGGTGAQCVPDMHCEFARHDRVQREAWLTPIGRHTSPAEQSPSFAQKSNSLSEPEGPPPDPAGPPPAPPCDAPPALVPPFPFPPWEGTPPDPAAPPVPALPPEEPSGRPPSGDSQRPISLQVNPGGQSTDDMTQSRLHSPCEQ